MNRESLGRFLGTRKGLLVLYLIFAGAYLGASSGRLRRHSEYNHFVYLADGWLKGRLALDGPPPNENDWAKVDVLELKDGRKVKGMFSKTGAVDRFHPLSGPSLTIADEDIASRSSIRYVSFPPFPAVPMLPFVAAWKLAFNDVVFTALWAALNPVLLFLLLRWLARRGHSQRDPVDDLWLVAMFGVGSVYYFCSVVGQVWFTAHVIGVTLVLGYAWASIDAHRPALAGLCLGLGFATRPSLGYMFPLFLWEAARLAGGWPVLKEVVRGKIPAGLIPRLVRFGVPAAAVVAALLVFNVARFERPFEFGHKYLNVGWQDRIQSYGLFNYHFLSRNLTAALTLTPRILAKAPYVQVSEHGMSLLLTSPFLVFLFMPQIRPALARPLWITAGVTALPSLLYQNSGQIQFGYRFSLDYMIYFMLLLAIGGRPIGRTWKLLVIAAFAVNLFGAIVFDRFGGRFTYNDSFFPNGNN